MKPNGIEALMTFMSSDIGQLIKNIIVKEIVPFAKQKLIDGASKPIDMSPEEQAARAESEFATVDLPEDEPVASQPAQGPAQTQQPFTDKTDYHY